MARSERSKSAAVPFDKEKHVFRSPELQRIVDSAMKFFGETPVHDLPPPGDVKGLGVYAIYYLGGFHLYGPVAAKNRSTADPHVPIYVGKAVPEGSRTGGERDEGTKRTKTVRSRLMEHRRSIQNSIEEATKKGLPSLDLKDFRCRFVILEDTEEDLIASVESGLIREHRPLWNSVMSGFGNHDPGKGRYDQAVSDWDVVHPGRLFATKLTGISPVLEDVIGKVKQAMRVFEESGGELRLGTEEDISEEVTSDAPMTIERVDHGIVGD